MNNVVKGIAFERNCWFRFWSIYRILERRRELNELVVWTRRKHLNGVERAYYTLLADEERRLFLAYRRYPHLTRFIHLIHTLKRFLAPVARYYPGYAANYRKGFLTEEIK